MAGQPATADEVRSSTLLRPVGAGQIIFGSALKREFAVKNGQPVKVIVNGASWSVATEAVAQGSGYVGDLVRARVNRSSRVVSGRVNSDGQLEVQ
jgi:flagella basal body P-ring formation protein FlgA